VLTRNIEVYPEIEARYTVDDADRQGCSPFTAQLASQSAYFGTNAPVPNVFWDFDDLTTSTGQTVTHQFVNGEYENPKVFNVSLIARSAEGCSDTATFTMTSNPEVVAAFNTSIVQPCTPVQYQFTDASGKNGIGIHLEFRRGTTISSGWGLRYGVR
jgi:PKD repeat protein